MAWVKLDDAMPHHPKVMAAGPEAFALDVAGICYSNAHATDGFIGTHSLPAVLPSLKNPRKFAAKLVEVGRWIATEDGWVIHDVADYQPTAAEQKELSKKRAMAGRKGGRESGKTRANTKQVASEPEAKPKQVASTESNPVPTRPDPIDQLPTVVGRARSPVWDVLVELFGPPAPPHRSLYGRVSTVLTDQDATPDQIRDRTAALAAEWTRKGETTRFSVAALEKWWGSFDGLVGQVSGSDVEAWKRERREQAALAEAAEMDRKALEA